MYTAKFSLAEIKSCKVINRTERRKNCLSGYAEIILGQNI